MEQQEGATGRTPVSRWEAIGFVWEVLLSVAVPTTLLGLGGRWVDRHYGSSPWATVLGLLLAIGISALIVLRRGKAMAERMKK